MESEESMPFSEGGIKLFEEYGVAWLLSPDCVSANRFVASRQSLRRAAFIPGAEIYFENKLMGTAYALRYLSVPGGLFLWFRRNGLALPSEESLAFYLNLAPCEIQCPVCESLFTPQDLPCDCIFKANCLIVRQIIVSGVKFFSIRHDYLMEIDSRAEFLGKQFGGGVEYLNFEGLE